MRMKTWTSLGAGAVALALFAAPVQAQGTYRDWDRDNDGRISAQEWNDGFGSRGTYDAWDADRSGDLSQDEFSTGVYSSYDVDGDGYLDEWEFSGYDSDFEEPDDQAAMSPSERQSTNPPRLNWQRYGG